MVESQVTDFDEVLKDTDLVVLMVKHDHITRNWHRLEGKAVLACHNFCPLADKVYRL